MEKSEDRLLTIRFNADTAAQMRSSWQDNVWMGDFNCSSRSRWNFRPQQPVVYVHPGETALAFYTAKNPTDKWVQYYVTVIPLLLPFLCRPIDGISTYNVVPFEAGAYFNKIQCFCFEEQRLNPGEEVGWTKPPNLIPTHPYIAGWYARLLLHWPRLCRGSVYAEHKWNNIELYFLWIEAGAPAPDLQSQCWKIADLEFESVNLL